ncbi:MAG TPA: iron-containing redox enzyme family protein [Pyrinomonadaceae bacterium]
MEEKFISMIRMDKLDQLIDSKVVSTAEFDDLLESALDAAFVKNDSQPGYHLFLQRVLYRVNRLKFFWYDDLEHYNNERSWYLRSVRERIEDKWQTWELAQLEFTSTEVDVEGELILCAQEDLSPEPSAAGKYFRDEVGIDGYRRLLEIASLDGLVEASQMSRTLGGVGNDIHSMMTRLLVEEYGGGRLARKHSSYFTVMLEAWGMNVTPEAYLQVVPWEVLATINHSFLLSERKRYYLRYIGGLLYTETSVPAAFENYRAAAQRLGMSEGARAYWELHIREDERHGRWMLNDVALPLAKLYPNHASEILLGYKQQKFMSDRAGQATFAEAKAADTSASGASAYEVAA